MWNKLDRHIIKKKTSKEPCDEPEIDAAVRSQVPAQEHPCIVFLASVDREQSTRQSSERHTEDSDRKEYAIMHARFYPTQRKFCELDHLFRIPKIGHRKLSDISFHPRYDWMDSLIYEWILFFQFYFDRYFFSSFNKRTVIFQFVDCPRCLACQKMNGILIAEPVRTFYSVVHVIKPTVRLGITDSSVYSTLCSNRVRSRWKKLRHYRNAISFAAQSKCSPQSCTTCSDHQAIVAMIDKRIIL